jgi:NAD(P)H-nitrite reductase large subunit
MAVSQREIVTAIDTLGLESAEQVAAHTRAGTGCGTCRGDLAAVLAAHRRQAAEPGSTPA